MRGNLRNLCIIRLFSIEFGGKRSRIDNLHMLELSLTKNSICEHSDCHVPIVHESKYHPESINNLSSWMELVPVSIPMEEL